MGLLFRKHCLVLIPTGILSVVALLQQRRELTATTTTTTVTPTAFYSDDTKRLQYYEDLLSLALNDTSNSTTSNLQYIEQAVARLRQENLEMQAELSLLMANHQKLSENVASSSRFTTNIGAAIKNKPSCKQLMNEPNSSYFRGDFLTSSRNIWIPRADGSRRFELEICELERYTADQARQCLKGKPVMFIGDSLTRYQYLNLASFIEKGHYPPNFPRRRASRTADCTHYNERGEPTCSPITEPNVCAEGDWHLPMMRDPRFLELGRDGWKWYVSELGGGEDSNTTSPRGNMLFDGRMECSCLRHYGLKGSWQTADNMHYVGTPVTQTLLNNSEAEGNTNNISTEDRVQISFVAEVGWGQSPQPVQGFNFSQCSWNNSCRFPKSLLESRTSRAQQQDFDWNQSLPLAVAEGGVLRNQLPRPTFAIYNRGLWGEAVPARTASVLQSLHGWIQEDQKSNGRCFFKSTTGSSRRDYRPYEIEKIRGPTVEAGCDYLDWGHVTAVFGKTQMDHHPTGGGEKDSVFFDSLHYHPWVYTELNNLMLNVLCNGVENL